MLRELCVSGYRSLRNIRVPLGRITIVVGANGVGKTNLYQALKLAKHAASGTLGGAIASEGGLSSMLWAGATRRGESKRVEIEISFEDMTYSMAVGFVPHATSSKFVFDSEVKEELVRVPVDHKVMTMLERAGKTALARDADGARVSWPVALWEGESVLSQLRDPSRFPILAELSVRLGALRFYHQFATDRHSPIRAPRVGVRTPMLDDDGHDLAAAFATIEDIGDGPGLRSAVAQAFPGSRFDVLVTNEMFALEMHSGLGRSLSMRELSDGTLRFLCLAVALTAPRPPAFVALNEPENSLHPDVLPAIAERLVHASEQSQIFVTTHSRALADAIAAQTSTTQIELERVGAETQIRKPRSRSAP